MPVPTLSQPPGRPDESYIIPFMGGELWTIPASNSVLRLVVTEKESNGDFAVITTGGIGDKPIGFHYHKEAHDVFLCQKGSINVWADDEARTLLPGDFASVPPGTVHQYQILGDHTEFVGLIIPGGWEEFFRFIGEPYSGSLFPTKDHRNPMEVLIPKLVQAAEKFDMIPKRDHKGGNPVLCSETDSQLPDSRKAFFLKADKGPRWAAGGLLVKPLARPTQTDGKFAIARIEGTNQVDSSALPELTFASSHHAFVIDQGSFSFKINGEQSTAATGETVFVPAGVSFSIAATSRHAAAFVFTNSGGIVEVLIGAGKPYSSPIIAEDFPVDVADLKSLEKSWNFKA
ncbi:hypothetical protein MBLNU459_g0862t1 [Dothideomycetes sp. NU459]